MPENAQALTILEGTGHLSSRQDLPSLTTRAPAFFIVAQILQT